MTAALQGAGEQRRERVFMPCVLAAVLALDQRIEWQFTGLLVVLGLSSLHRHATFRLDVGKAFVALVATAACLLVNSLSAFIDPVHMTDGWWMATFRVALFYLMLIGLSSMIASRAFDAEAVLRTVEWLVVFKLAVAVFELWFVLSTGTPRERPLFNIILSPDSLFGIRLTSSYDILFALLALARHRPARRGLALLTMILLTETRALLLLSALFAGWRLLGPITTRALALATAGAAAAALLAVALSMQPQTDSQTRLLQFRGSSLDDKQEQVELVATLIPSPYLLTGRGFGASLPGLVRDEARPYSYEAQALVLLWQGGVLFYLLHLGMLYAYAGGAEPARTASILTVLGLSLLNPTLFALASAFFVVVLGKLIGTGRAGGR